MGDQVASLDQGAPWIIVALLTWLVLACWLIRYGDSKEDMIRAMMDLNLRQMLTLRGLLLSIPAFMILGLALWSIPK